MPRVDSMSIFATRRQRLLKVVKDEGLDAVLITNPINVTYLTGFSGDSSYLIIAKSKTFLVSDGRYREQIAEECQGLDVFIRGPALALPEATIEQLRALAPRNL